METTIQKAGREAETLYQLLDVWESAVRTTHTFLSSEEVETLKPEVLGALQDIRHLYCYTENGQPLGFIGVQEEKIEMLFVDETARGKGVGKQLLAFALETLGASRLDVNEQNPQGVGFYEHMGFRVAGRSETDEQGRPYPLLHMEIDA